MNDSLSPTRHGRRAAPPSSLERPPDDTMSLQLALGFLFTKATPMTELHAPVNVFGPPFLADVLGVIAREAFEVNATPATYIALRDETDKLVTLEAQRLARTFERRAARGQPVPSEWTAHAQPSSWMDDFVRCVTDRVLPQRTQFDDVTEGCGAIDTIERDLRQRISLDDVEPLDYPDPLDRLSPLGVYFRRVLVKLRKLTFNETAVLARQVAAWCAAGRGESTTPSNDYNWGRTQHIESRDPYTSSEARELTRVGQMERYEQAMDAGNYIAAYHVLVQFHDYQPRVDEATSNGMMPHKLLNLASFHYRVGGLASALEAVDESIRLARRQEESACLQDALSLRQRIVAETDAAAWRGGEVPRVKDAPLPLRRLMKAATPLDDMWALKTAVDLGEPVPVALRRVYTALGRTLPSEAVVDDEETGPTVTPVLPTLNAGAWHAAQAGLWSMMGSQALAEAHEGMALSAGDLDHETFVSVQVSRAERFAARGDVDAALATLVGMSTLERMDMGTYRVWARGVWGVLESQAALAGDAAAEGVIRGLRADKGSAARGGPGAPVRDVWEPCAAPALNTSERGIVFAHGYVTHRLELVRARLEVHAPPHRMFQDVLAALEIAAALGLWPLYRSATVLLADVLLAMDVTEDSGMAAKADAELARIWDELVAGSDAPALARAALARAKAHAAMATAHGVSPETVDTAHLASAAQFADLALERAAALNARPLGSEAALLRDLLTKLGASPPTSHPRPAPSPNLADQARRIGEIVRLVGVRVAEGWR